MSRQEEQLDAAEYVIGTLSAVERAAFEALVESNPRVRADVAFWERTFGDLNEAVPEVAPPEKLWTALEQRLAERGLTGEEIAAKTPSADESRSSAVLTSAHNEQVLKRSRSRWRFVAMAASIAALGLGGYVANQQTDFAPEWPGGSVQQARLAGDSYMAVVNANGDQPSMVVSVNAKNGTVKVRVLDVDVPAENSLELWYIADGAQPVSVGLVGDENVGLGTLAANQGDVLAVSVEPTGGSPESGPTGPVIYTGRLIRVD